MEPSALIGCERAAARCRNITSTDSIQVQPVFTHACLDTWGCEIHLEHRQDTRLREKQNEPGTEPRPRSPGLQVGHDGVLGGVYGAVRVR